MPIGESFEVQPNIQTQSLWQASSGTSSLRWTKTKLAPAVRVRLPDIRMTLQPRQEQRIHAAPEPPSPRVTARESQRYRPVGVFPSREVRSCGFLSSIWSLPRPDTMYQLGALLMRKGTAPSTAGAPAYLVLKTGKARASELRPRAEVLLNPFAPQALNTQTPRAASLPGRQAAALMGGLVRWRAVLGVKGAGPPPHPLRGRGRAPGALHSTSLCSAQPRTGTAKGGEDTGLRCLSRPQCTYQTSRDILPTGLGF